MNVYKVKGTVAECIKNETVSIGLLKSFQNGSSPLRGRHFFVFFNPSRFLNAVSIKIAGRKITIAKCSIQQLAFPKWKRKPGSFSFIRDKASLKTSLFPDYSFTFNHGDFARARARSPKNHTTALVQIRRATHTAICEKRGYVRYARAGKHHHVAYACACALSLPFPSIPLYDS